MPGTAGKRTYYLSPVTCHLSPITYHYVLMFLMQPLAVSRYSVVNCLGAGATALLDALREKRSGLAPCDFEAAALDTWIGRVPGLEEIRVRPDLGAYDCRNNRLAQLG